MKFKKKTIIYGITGLELINVSKIPLALGGGPIGWKFLTSRLPPQII